MRVRFGVMADAHIEFMHDGEARVRTFFETCLRERCDFCVDLGDFCPPGKTNGAAKEAIRAMMKGFPLPFYHILGNHDTDENKKSAVFSYLGCENQKRSFDFGGVHFLLVDACAYREGEDEIEYENGNYRTSHGELPILTEAELSYIREDLAAAKHPAVLFSHQSLIESRTGIRNAEALREALGYAKNGVLLCICGHEHVDRLEKKDGIYYFCLNSMSYYWAGERFAHDTYPQSITDAHPMLRLVFPYRDPLFSIIEITDEQIVIRGRTSQIVGSSPRALQFKKWGLEDPITAAVRTRTLPLKEKSLPK